jgi:hypothetical protein
LATVRPSSTFSKRVLTGELGDDGACQWIPVGQNGAGFDLLVRPDRQDGTVRHFVTLALAAEVVMDDDFA